MKPTILSTLSSFPAVPRPLSSRGCRLPRARFSVNIYEMTCSLSWFGGGLPLFTENPRRVLLGNLHSYARVPIRYRGVWWRHVCSPGFLEEFFSETQLTLPAKRRSFGSCQCPPRVGKHYQNYDEDSHYLRYCDNSFQCSPWRQDYPRRSQKEVERTNNNGGPVAPCFEHP